MKIRWSVLKGFYTNLEYVKRLLRLDFAYGVTYIAVAVY
jgi:hypothetical protein